MRRLLPLLLALPLAGSEIPVAVNDYFGVGYEREPVSFDVEPETPCPVARIGIEEQPSQVEVLAGTPGAVTKARVWTLVTLPREVPAAEASLAGDRSRHLPLTLIVDGDVPEFLEWRPPLTATPDEPIGRVPTAVVDNGLVRVRVPAGSVELGGTSALDLPGPVVSIARRDGEAIGRGYLDAIDRVEAVTVAAVVGSIYAEYDVTYRCAGGKTYRARVRLYPGKPWVRLVEDFDLGGNARYVFNYGDWQATDFLRTGDNNRCKWQAIAGATNPCHDFVTIPGQTALARMVVWTQFNYFGGKQETVALRDAVDGLAVGGFYLRPDRWTRAKVNHVDLYRRPELPGRPLTRGVAGLADAEDRLALEAWLVDGHREWALFAVPAVEHDWLVRAHVREGVWPLDRLNRLSLVWNADGSPVAPADTVPGNGPVGGIPGQVLHGTKGRSGLQVFNGSNGNIRGGCPDPAGWDGKVDAAVRAGPEANNALVGLAARAYFASDESAYPGVRAMLPWSDPEALNPFYQGMENMNFNADLYRYVYRDALALSAKGHPEAARFREHSERSLDMALDRYVYPRSGCWEESHGYAGHTLKVLAPLVRAIANSGGRDHRDDPRLARMLGFFVDVYSPVDRDFHARVVPPIGDHGLSRASPTRRLGRHLKLFAAAEETEVRRIAARVAGLIREEAGPVPDGIAPAPPGLASRWLQGYGAVLRGYGETAAVDVVLRDLLVRGEKEMDLWLRLVRTAEGFAPRCFGRAPTYNTAPHEAVIAESMRTEDGWWLELDYEVFADKWVKGGTGHLDLDVVRDRPDRVGYSGTFKGRQRTGSGTWTPRPAESFCVVRAGQSWGHHHADKGSLWFWGRGVHFFGDAAWGGPPGGTYWNPYKQQAPSGTQIELVGINNWTLPCKFPAPWIADCEFAAGFDYVLARCLYPYNPPLDCSRSTPVALSNGYDRQVLFVHPDLLIVRDDLDTTCPAIWRMHSYQPEGTTIDGHRAELASPHGVSGDLVVAHPAGVALELHREIPDVLPVSGRKNKAAGEPFAGKAGASAMLRWGIPAGADVTWVFAVRADGEDPAAVETLEARGRVVRVALADGTTVVACMANEPFTWEGDAVTFTGTAGLLVTRDGATERHAIRGEFR